MAKKPSPKPVDIELSETVLSMMQAANMAAMNAEKELKVAQERMDIIGTMISDQHGVDLKGKKIEITSTGIRVSTPE